MMLRGLAVAWLAAFVVCACAGGEGSANRAEGPRRPIYKPGQSLEARLCACRECFDIACCKGDPGAEEGTTEGELGISMRACGRCVRRTWTARGAAACAQNAPDTCCPDSMTD